MSDEPASDSPPTEERVRLELVLFAELIQRLESEGRLTRALPFVMNRLGDLRRLLFDYEVRGTERLLPLEDPAEREARRILRELEERKEEMLEEWQADEGWTPDDDGAPDGPDGSDGGEGDDGEGGGGTTAS